MRLRIRAASFSAAALLIAGCAGNARLDSRPDAQIDASAGHFAIPAGPSAPPDESRTISLAGNVHPLSQAAFDEGPIDPATRLDRLILLFKLSQAQQAALDELTDDQQDPQSPLYHQWLTPSEFGARFGVNDADLSQVAAWLAARGFTVNEVPAGRRIIVFSGTAAQVTGAFHTELRHYGVNGVTHLANASDPRIPASLADSVAGVVSLHDFRRSSLLRTPTAFSAQPNYSAGSTHYLFPADFASIYDLNPLYGTGVDGAGASIAIAGRSNIELSDVATFRSMAGLAPNTPTVTLAGADPGLVAKDREESTLDVEWSGAVAPAAAIDLVVAASTATTDGVDLAAAAIVNQASAPIISVSYRTCELEMGAAELAFYNSLWEQAASEGISVFVASGDAGAAGCDAASDTTGTRAAVNGLCSSPFATCVGGTEFDEGSDAAAYWSSANSSAYGSALGYIPEEVWNESALNGGSGLWASGGGASIVYPQPSWQANVSGTSAANGMRAVPDVALSAADHDGYFMVESGSYWIVSGTSVAAPSFAGIMALVVDSRHGAAQGNANPRLYSLAGSADNAFHATASGDNSVPGIAGFTAAGAEYNLATGLGSVDGALLIGAWGAADTVPPTLALTDSSQSITLPQGSSAALALTVSTGGSFSGSVDLSVSGLPSGVTSSWSANPLTTAAAASTSSVTLTLTASPAATAGSFPIVLSASGDSLTSSQNAAVVVQPRANGCLRFSLLPARCRPPLRTLIR
ncbi:MAG: protease pro-enzyme activation domain-containing protein [Terracidiphilus sp.]